MLIYFIFISRKKDEELAENAIRQNELKLEIEHLKSLVNQKVIDRKLKTL
jgi:hypothetical protein